MGAVWQVLFAGDQMGYLNSVLLRMGVIDNPIAFLSTDATTFLMPIMILVGLWSSMGVGFLAMVSGILNVDPEQYEAAYIDGVKNRFQEVIYVTIPNIKPQMLFSAVMAIVGTFSASGMGVALTGSNPTPQYAGQVIVNHIEDFGFIRFEMGYAAALSVILLGIIWIMSRVSYRLFGDN
jgi:multiple sugar transport system permease protein